jgi:tRNA (guanine-N7-)-methyltransferase
MEVFMRLRNIPAAADAIAESKYCIQDFSDNKGNWHEIFGNKNPIAMEIGMGKGRFIMDLASLHPDINYIGVERYGSVLYRALQKMEEHPLPNLRFLCINAEILPEIFEAGELDQIYLNFSDPWPKDRHARRRLTSREFLACYDKVLKKDGHIEFKTDNRPLFDFSLEEVKEAGWNLDGRSFDLHHDEIMNQNNIMTEYEEKFSSLGNPICKMIISRS